MERRVLTALPVYNEARHIDGVLRQVLRYASDVLVVDDGSTDAAAAELAKFPQVRVVRHPVNQGYGAALRSAFHYADEHGFDALVTIDCDGQHQPELIPELAARLDSDGVEWDIVSGSRYLARFAGDSAPPADRRRINVTVTELLNNHLGLHLTDAFCGFKAYRVSSLPKLEITELGYAMPLQLWVQAVAHGFRIVEHPVPLVYLEEKRSFGGALDDARRRLEHYRAVINRELAAADLPALAPLECGLTAALGCEGY